MFHVAGEAAQVPGAGRRVLFVGRFVEKKGLAVLRALAQARGDLTFLLAGSGPIRPECWGLANVHVLGVQAPEALARLRAMGLKVIFNTNRAARNAARPAGVAAHAC